MATYMFCHVGTGTITRFYCIRHRIYLVHEDVGSQTIDRLNNLLFAEGAWWAHLNLV